MALRVPVNGFKEEFIELCGPPHYLTVENYTYTEQKHHSYYAVWHLRLLSGSVSVLYERWWQESVTCWYSQLSGTKMLSLICMLRSSRGRA